MKVDYDNLYKKMKQQYYDETLAHYNQVYEKARDKNIAKQIIVAQLTFPYLFALSNPYIEELINLFDLNWRLGNSFNEVVKEIPALREKHIDLMKYGEAIDEKKMEITDTQVKDNTISQNFSFIPDSSYAFEREFIDITDDKELLAYYAQYHAIREFIEYLGGVENILKEENKNQASLSQLPTIDEKEFTAKRRGLALHYLNKYYKLNKMQDVTILTDFAVFLTGNSRDNLYKVLTNPLGMTAKTSKGEKVTAKEQIKNLEFIRPYFERLGLHEITKLIDNDLNSI